MIDCSVGCVLLLPWIRSDYTKQARPDHARHGLLDCVCMVCLPAAGLSRPPAENLQEPAHPLFRRVEMQAERARCEPCMGCLAGWLPWLIGRRLAYQWHARTQPTAHIYAHRRPSRARGGEAGRSALTRLAAPLADLDRPRSNRGVGSQQQPAASQASCQGAS